jgi:alpha-1,2-mannosyltransferase
VIVHPPCSCAAESEADGGDDDSGVWLAAKARLPVVVVSIGQWRPEKRQADQVKALHRLLLAHPEHWGKVQLVLVGSVRGPEDAKRKEQVRKLAAERGLLASGAVEMPEDVDAVAKRDLLRRAAVGLHTMRDEHFGICVVEYMAAGAVPLAHNSAGPRLDIVVPALTAETIPAEGSDGGHGAVGMLAETEQEYADCLHHLLARPALREAMAQRARKRAGMFSIEQFHANFIKAMGPLLQPQ